jgi:hypothetical protein
MKIQSDAELNAEAMELLAKHLSPTKMARLAVLWNIGCGDYTRSRDLLLEGETVDSLFARMKRRFETRNAPEKHAP